MQSENQSAQSAGASESLKETAMPDINIIEQLGNFFAGLGDLFGGLFKALGVVFEWAGLKAAK